MASSAYLLVAWLAIAAWLSTCSRASPVLPPALAKQPRLPPKSDPDYFVHDLEALGLDAASLRLLSDFAKDVPANLSIASHSSSTVADHWASLNTSGVSDVSQYELNRISAITADHLFEHFVVPAVAIVPSGTIPTLVYNCNFFMDICSNIRQYLQDHNLPATGTRLTYLPDTTQKDANRNAACPGSVGQGCKTVFACDTRFTQGYNWRTSCDEFPFAASYQGGAGARRSCVSYKEQQGQSRANQAIAFFKDEGSTLLWNKQKSITTHTYSLSLATGLPNAPTQQGSSAFYAVVTTVAGTPSSSFVYTPVASFKGATPTVPVKNWSGTSEKYYATAGTLCCTNAFPSPPPTTLPRAYNAGYAPASAVTALATKRSEANAAAMGTEIRAIPRAMGSKASLYGSSPLSSALAPRDACTNNQSPAAIAFAAVASILTFAAGVLGVISALIAPGGAWVALLSSNGILSTVRSLILSLQKGLNGQSSQAGFQQLQDQATMQLQIFTARPAADDPINADDAASSLASLQDLVDSTGAAGQQISSAGLFGSGSGGSNGITEPIGGFFDNPGGEYCSLNARRSGGATFHARQCSGPNSGNPGTGSAANAPPGDITNGGAGSSSVVSPDGPSTSCAAIGSNKGITAISPSVAASQTLVLAGTIRDAGNGYIGFLLPNYNNQPLSFLLQDSSSSSACPDLYGATYTGIKAEFLKNCTTGQTAAYMNGQPMYPLLANIGGSGNALYYPIVWSPYISSLECQKNYYNGNPQALLATPYFA